jgi:hypothetical protein
MCESRCARELSRSPGGPRHGPQAALGGPDPDGRAILALSTKCRHPAIAIAVKNFPDQHFGALILLYLLLSILVGVPYTLWQQRRAAAQEALPASSPII